MLKGVTYRGTQRSPATVNRYLASLSHALTLAVKEWGWLYDSPIKRVSRSKESRGRVRFLSHTEKAALLEACQNSDYPYLYLIVVLALSTGMRRGEIMSLRWEKVDLDRGVIFIEETKNGERRSVPIRGQALDLIKKLQTSKKRDFGLLFPSVHSWDKPAHLRRFWEKALKEAAIQDFRFHDLRHSAASYLAMSGATPSEIAEVLGHRTLQMVKRYAHISQQHSESVVEKMNQMFLSESL